MVQDRANRGCRTATGSTGSTSHRILSYREGMRAPSLLHSGAGMIKTHDRMAQVAVRCDVRGLMRGTRGEDTHGARVGTREYRTTCRYGAGPGPRPCRGDPAGGRV